MGDEEDIYTVEPWVVREPRPRLDSLTETETVFALSNGCLGIRGTLDEGGPVGMPGTYLAGLHELRTMVYTEAGYGDPEETQTLVNTIDGTLVALSVDGHPLDLRAGEVLAHERVLDMRAGTLVRELRWRCPAGQQVEVRSERLVSFRHRGVAAIRYTVRAVDGPAEVALTSSLVANVQLPHLPSHPSAQDLLRHPLDAQEHHADGQRITLVHRTCRSGFAVAAAADHRLESPAELETHVDSDQDWARLTTTARLEAGQEITLVKLLGYAWSADRSLTAVRDEVSATLTTARHSGWDALVAAQREYLDAFWGDADVEIDGDDELQQATRFALWHLLQATARAEGRGIAGKALTGTGYEGHVFWDTETFVLQAMTALRPEITRHALEWRHSTLDLARDRARQLDLRGAAFPWRTIDGIECSGYWPAGAAAFHVDADIADAAIRYVECTGDEAFARSTGIDLLVETARLWASQAHQGRDGTFHILGVTGPDEYSALSDDNVYTNLMAQRNLLHAARWARRYPDCAARLAVDADEIDGWEAAGKAVAVPYDADRGVHPQAAGFTDQPRWDFEGTDPDHYPLHSHFPYLQLYRKQVVKQADLVLAMLLRGDAFTDEDKARNVAYYEAVTVRDSSLSACCQAVLCAEVGHLDLAHSYLAESALADLRDASHDSSDGLHLAALAGTWIAVAAGFGGMRQVDGELRFRPALPAALPRVAFRLRHLGRRLRVTVTADRARYEVVDGEPLTVRHEQETLRLAVGEPVERPTVPRTADAEPRQPAHCAPRRRSRPPVA
ncbi:glycoside hydrolase family 65 protein [Pseudonocardia sp. KRD-184]|uniref:Glycoside hydrolase family 65 protein n=2 Tax=Pseudonocardia oceani TaxID=2792013 RepID=A0ABS6U470_9PSEU|nr:glycosyl hydrolase family 65 protein [Pseudonocardia oceani]MBW0099748.1 glycoside hydrolase family 65 protein [Pseudonocardia oceani]MBW0124926.1 glycoside hydrolase family 65 protein [Pseudonocardia oceani]MBW0127013.1 glycoside hydrolase family 65 protein [Pseudonocardia oceani]